MGEGAVLAADDEDRVVLQPLGVVDGHQGDQLPFLLDRVLVGEQRDLLQELLQRRHFALPLALAVEVELTGRLGQRFEVLDPALGLDRALVFERFQIAGLAQHRLQDVGDRGAGVDPGFQQVDGFEEAGDRLDRGGAEARHLLGPLDHLPDRQPGGIGVGNEPALGRVADPAPRRVDDPLEGDLVGGVEQQVEVGDRVLDLGPVIELGAADHLVWQLVANQRVLEDPAHRVGPVEDRNIGARHPMLLPQPLDLGGDPARLLVVVAEFGELDFLAPLDVGPELLRPPLAVAFDDRVGGREDRLRRAIVLLELDHGGIREVLLEVKDVADVGVAEAVDRVVGDDPVGDEVVGSLDVDVVDGPVEFDPLNRRNRVVAAVFGEHRHPRPDRGGGQERQRVAGDPAGLLGAETSRETDVDVQYCVDLSGQPYGLPIILEHGLKAPGLRFGLRRTDAQPDRFERLAPGRVTPCQGNSVHRRGPPTLSAEGDSQHAASPVRGRGEMVRMLDAEPLVVEQAPAPRLGVESREDIVNQLLIADEALTTRRFTSIERQHR